MSLTDNNDNSNYQENDKRPDVVRIVFSVSGWANDRQMSPPPLCVFEFRFIFSEYSQRKWGEWTTIQVRNCKRRLPLIYLIIRRLV